MSNDNWGKPKGWGNQPPKEDVKFASWYSPAAKCQKIGRSKRETKEKTNSDLYFEEKGKELAKEIKGVLEPPKQNAEGVDDYFKEVSGWGTSFVEKKPNPVIIGIDPASKVGDKSVIVEAEVMDNDQFKIISMEETNGCFYQGELAQEGEEIELQIPSFDCETDERIEDQFITALVIKVGMLGVVVNREVDARVYHIPTLAKFDSAFPEREPGTRFSRKMLVDWCRRVQDEGPQETWAIVNALTPDTYNDAVEAKAGLREFCRSVPMKE